MSIEHTILLGDAVEQLRMLESGVFYTCVTSPPYFGLRDYGAASQIGLENTPEAYIQRLVEVFREVWRVLRDDGTLWVNIGDSYAGSWRGRNADGSGNEKSDNARNKGSRIGTVKKQKDSFKPKDLIGIPWMLAFALRSDGWYLRQDIVWNKSNAMPESVKDRCTRSHEYIFLLSKSPRYYFDAETIREPRVSEKNDAVAGSLGAFGPAQTRRRGSGCKERIFRPTPGTPHLGGHIPYNGEKEKRNRRDVWTISTGGYKGVHFATFPEKLVEPCILAGCPAGGMVLDPFAGSGTTGAVAKRLRREFVGIEINEEYAALTRRRIAEAVEPMEQLVMEGAMA